MTTSSQIEHIVENDFLAEVEVQLIEDDEPGMGWGPYYSLADMRKLETVRSAMRAENLAEASQYARVYRLTPVSAA